MLQGLGLGQAGFSLGVPLPKQTSVQHLHSLPTLFSFILQTANNFDLPRAALKWGTEPGGGIICNTKDWMRNVLSDPLFLDIGKATGTYTSQVGNRTISLLQCQVLQGNSIASEHFFLVFLSPRRDVSSVFSVTCGEMEGIALPCCLQLFPSTQTSSHYFPYARKPASKALGIWQYSAEGWLSRKSIQIQCLAGVSPSRHCLLFCTLQQAAGDNCHPRTFLPVPFLLFGPGKN